jgi:hypothetical protein
MAATYQVILNNGVVDGTPTKAVITNARFHSSDSNASDLLTPVLIDSVARRSYWKSISLRVNGAFTQVDNIRHYSDGTIGWTLGTAGKLNRGNRDSGDHGCLEASFEAATGTSGTTGHAIDDAVDGHTFYNGQTTKTANVANDTSGSPATISTVAITSAGVDSKHIVMQVLTDTDGTQGVQSTETLTWKVDEI